MKTEQILIFIVSLILSILFFYIGINSNFFNIIEGGEMGDDISVNQFELNINNSR